MVFKKKLKRPGFYKLIFYILIINQDLNKKKNPEHPRKDLVGNMWKILAKNIKFYGSWNLSRFSIFQTNNLISWK